MASHVIYYSDKNGTSDFIQKILKKTGLASIIVAQASGSVLNSFSNAYSHSSKIKNIFQKLLITTSLPSKIDFVFSLSI